MHPAKEDWLAIQLRGFGPMGLSAIALIIIASLLFTPLGALLVLLWAWRSGLRWSELGFSRPPAWWNTVAVGIAGGILLKLVQKSILMPLLGAPAVNPYFHFIEGNAGALARMLAASIIIGGICEEIVYRGYLFERLGRWWGGETRAKAAMIGLTTALFAVIHYPDQGLAGAQQAVFTGLAFGTVYAMTGRLWLPMLVHATYNASAVLMIYFGLEQRVAGWFF